MQRGKLGPRGVPGKPSPGKMTPQVDKNTPTIPAPATRDSTARGGTPVRSGKPELEKSQFMFFKPRFRQQLPCSAWRYESIRVKPPSLFSPPSTKTSASF